MTNLISLDTFNTLYIHGAEMTEENAVASEKLNAKFKAIFNRHSRATGEITIAKLEKAAITLYKASDKALITPDTQKLFNHVFGDALRHSLPAWQRVTVKSSYNENRCFDVQDERTA